MGRQTKREKKFAPKIKGEIQKRKIRQQNEQRKSKGRGLPEQANPEAEPIINEEKPKTELAQHKDELEALRSTQKEFFEFLEKEDSGLLQFGEDELQDDEEEEEDHILTQELFEQWKKEAPTSIKITKKLVQAFHYACHINDTEDDSTKAFSERFKILNSSIFNELMLFCIKDLPKLFDTHLKRGEKKVDEEDDTQSDKKQPFLPDKYPTRWNKVKPLARGFVGALLHFLGGLSEPQMLGFVLKNTQQWVHYFGPFPKLSNRFLKALLVLWSSANETVRILSFLNIRQLAIDLPFPFIESCLKGIYITYVRNAKFTNEKTQGLINFMTNCVVELYGLDSSSAYSHAFVYLREVAVHLRTAYTTKTKANQQQVYNWQTLNSIKVWVQLLATFPQDKQLWLLAYPLVQLIHGIINLLPIARYYPLRCHCLRMLNDLAKSGSEANIFLNSASYVVDMLQYDGFYKKIKPYSGKKFNASHLLAVPENLLGTKTFQDFITTEVQLLLKDYFANYSSSIAFPELVVPVLVALKRFISKKKSAPTTGGLRTLVDALQSNSQFILAKRNKVTFGPQNVDSVSNFAATIGVNNPFMKYKDNQDTLIKNREEAALRNKEENLKAEKTRKEKRAAQNGSDDEGDDDDSDEDMIGKDDNESEDDEVDFDSDRDFDEDDDDEDEDMESAPTTPKKKGAKGVRALKTQTEGDDEVEDLDISKW
eukprot:TRINITY_DN2141_c0_g1_i1.p1 TRINITY_DN2141_c0_g1~~TRINITY_DN2141_c0_g1_i1.p1  ORF type:complete len:709 (-),score=206.78 TRINITY_DN2141_c0_g1_i1:52-2178(-)